MQLRLLLKFLLTASLVSAQLIGYAVPAANYFVDKDRGSDSNGGTRPGNAFATLTHAMSAATTGQLVAVNGGGSNGGVRFAEQATLPAANVALVGWLGRPLIDCSDSIPSGNFSKTAGRTNIYQATVTVANVLGWIRAWEDNVYMPRAASLAALDSAPGSYFVSGDPTGGNGTSFTLYVYPTGAGDPATNLKTYDYNARAYGVFSNLAGNRVAHFIMRRNLDNNGSLELGATSQVSDVAVNDGTKHNALMRGGSTWTDVSATDSYYNSAKILIVLNDTFPTGQDATLVNTICGETIQAGDCLYGHVNSGGLYGVVTVKNLNSTGVANSISGFAASVMIVDGGSLNASTTAASPTNILKNFTSAGQIIVPYTSAVEVDTVTVAGTFQNGSIRFGTGTATAPDINIHNSDLSNSRAFDGAIYISSSVVPASFTVLNNIFRAPVQNNHIGGPGAATLPAASGINGNTYHYAAATSAFIVFRGTNYNISVLTPSGWTAWQALGFDATGSRVTP